MGFCSSMSTSSVLFESYLLYFRRKMQLEVWPLHMRDNISMMAATKSIRSFMEISNRYSCNPITTWILWRIKENILVTQREPNRPIAKISDFDFSGELREHGTLNTIGISTRGYIAPEILIADSPKVQGMTKKDLMQSLMEKGDVFAIGLTIYQVWILDTASLVLYIQTTTRC